MIVKVPSKHVKAHEPEELKPVRVLTPESVDKLEKIFVIQNGQTMRYLKKPASTCHMHPATFWRAVKTTYSKKARTGLRWKKPRLWHFQTAVPCTGHIGIFFGSRRWTILARWKLYNPWLAINRNKRFWTRSSRRARQHPQAVDISWIVQRLVSKHAPTLLPASIQVADGASHRAGKAMVGLKHEGSHGAISNEAEALKHSYRTWVHSAGPERPVEKKPSPSVRHGVVEHAKHSIQGIRVSNENTGVKRQAKRANWKARLSPCRVIGKGHAPALVQGDGAYSPVRQRDKDLLGRISAWQMHVRPSQSHHQWSGKLAVRTAWRSHRHNRGHGQLQPRSQASPCPDARSSSELPPTRRCASQAALE